MGRDRSSAAPFLLGGVWLCLSLVFCGEAHAARQASFALIIGVNRSVDRDLRKLQYADDDAVRYFDLFRSLGLRTYLLTTPDRNTRRLHAQAIAEAYRPRRASLRRVVRLLAAEIAKARRRGLKTNLYFVYAGHGAMKGGQGYLSLEDHRLTGQLIRREVLDLLRADQSHLIIDACHSYFLAHSRGPGGQRRSLRDFSRIEQALIDEKIGLLLSTSAAQESHEWAAFQAGVFSHEVRSGLYGAADADGDGQVSYREIAAFVHRANAAIPNERFRPRVFARPPRSEPILLDLRLKARSSLVIGARHHGRYLLETDKGVRLMDFHSSRASSLRLLRPPSAGTLYLRSLTDDREYKIPPGQQHVAVSSLAAARPRVASRGAAHHAFSKIFSRPYDRRVVAAFELSRQRALALRAVAPPRPSIKLRTVLGFSALGVGAAALATGIYYSVSAADLRDSAADGLSHQEAFELNGAIEEKNVVAAVLYGVAGAMAAAGVLTLLWPDSPAFTAINVVPGGASIAMTGRF